MLSKTKAKYIQSLNHKKVREEEQVFIAEGQKVVLEFLSSGDTTCLMLIVTKACLANIDPNILNKVGELILAESFEIKKVSQLANAPDILGIFSQKEITAPVLSGKLSIMLDGIRDPGNLGTIIRIADWFAIENIICSKDTVDCYNSKVVQASMGSLLRLNIWYTDIESYILANNTISVYAATLEGQDVYTIGSITEGILVIGNESAGIRENILGLIDKRVSIPRSGKAESLNAAVACGILLSSLTKAQVR